MRSRWYGRRNENHWIGANIASANPPMPTTPAVPNHHHDTPPRNSTNTPLASTSTAVPRSRCSRISPTGRAITSSANASVGSLGGRRRRSSVHASIIGKVSLVSSDGWKLKKPRLIQWLPYLPLPMNNTSTSGTSDST